MKKMILNVLKILLLVLAIIFLELNKNTLLGWGLLIVEVMLYIVLYKNTGINKFVLFVLAVSLYVFIVYISWPPYKFVPAVSNPNPKSSETIKTNYGKVRGVLNKDESVAVFAGIPYAKAPIGDLRFKEPSDPLYYEGVLITDHFAARSMQETNLPFYDSLVRIIGYHDYKISINDNYREPVSENSLYLNVFKPNKEISNAPVMVFIHGGSLQNGESSSQSYNGEAYAKNDVVFVSLTYRLGVFGFFADEELMKESKHNTTGNYGLLDCIKALEWIKENIAYFGGDPENITLAGESAGSALVSALCSSPLSKDLFKRAVLESSTVVSKTPPHSYRQLSAALSSGKALKERYNVSSVEELRKLDASVLVKEASSQHHITVDGYALLEDPYLSYQKGIHNEEAIIHGYNSKESGPFILFDQADLSDYEKRIKGFFKEYGDEVLALYPASSDKQARDNWADIYSCIYFNYPHYCLNRLALKNNIPVYEYYFNKDNNSLGPWHSGEMVYFYHNIPENSFVYNESDRKLSDTMSSYLINYIKTGDPNGKDLVYWPENKDNNTLLLFDEKVETVNEKFLDLYRIMDKFYGFEE